MINSDKIGKHILSEPQRSGCLCCIRPRKRCKEQCIFVSLFNLIVFFFFKKILLFIIIIIILLYNIVLVFPYISMNLPLVYTCSPSWTPLPPPSPYHPSRSSQCTSPKHPVSCIKPKLVIHFLHDSIYVSMPFSQIIPPSSSPTESKRLFFTSVSLLLSRIQGYRYHLSKFHIYALVYCIGFFSLAYFTLYNRLQFHPSH